MEGLKDEIRALAKKNVSILEGMLLLAEVLENLESEYHRLNIAVAKDSGFTKGLSETLKSLAGQVDRIEGYVYEVPQDTRSENKSKKIIECENCKAWYHYNDELLKKDCVVCGNDLVLQRKKEQALQDKEEKIWEEINNE